MWVGNFDKIDNNIDNLINYNLSLFDYYSVVSIIYVWLIQSFLNNFIAFYSSQAS